MNWPGGVVPKNMVVPAEAHTGLAGLERKQTREPERTPEIDVLAQESEQSAQLDNNDAVDLVEDKHLDTIHRAAAMDHGDPDLLPEF